MNPDLSPIERIAIKWGDKFDADDAAGKYPNVKFIILDAINEATREVRRERDELAALLRATLPLLERQHGTVPTMFGDGPLNARIRTALAKVKQP